MGAIRKTITLTEKQDNWIKTRIEAGEFTNDSEYLRALVQRDQEYNIKLLAMKSAIQEGIDSGISKRTVPEIMKAVEDKMRADGRL